MKASKFLKVEKKVFVSDVSDGVKDGVSSSLDHDFHAVIRGGGEQDGGFGDSAQSEDVVEEVARVRRHQVEFL